jgi:hypothetical protein
MGIKVPYGLGTCSTSFRGSVESYSNNPASTSVQFELGWLHRDGFSNMVKRHGRRPFSGQTPSRDGITNCALCGDSLEGRPVTRLGCSSKRKLAYDLALMN